MTGKKVLILGGGIGGLSTAHQLRRLLPAEHQIVVIERSSTFYIRSFNMRLLAGEMKQPREGERSLASLQSKGIECLNAEVIGIDPKQKMVETTSGSIQADYMVIALGAERVPETVSGFKESAYNLYDPYDVVRLKPALDAFEGGRIVILVCTSPFSCPAAPYEAALLIDSMCRPRCRLARAVPMMAWLSLSLPPLVKMTSSGVAPISAATCSRARATAALTSCP